MKTILAIMLALSYSSAHAAEPSQNDLMKKFTQLGEPSQKNCWGKLCVETGNSSLPDMFSRPDKAERMRIKEGHSGFEDNNDFRPKASFSYTWGDE